MRSKLSLYLAACSALAGSYAVTAQAEEKAEGFIEGSSLTVLNRNFYFNRDNCDSSAPTYNSGKGNTNGYSEAWAHAIITNFNSGFTQGTVGFGIDAFAMIGLKLDTGDGRKWRPQLL